jgi:hypothetical protein
MEHTETLETVSVSRGFLDSLRKEIRDLEDHVTALETVNRELTAAVNAQEE